MKNRTAPFFLKISRILFIGVFFAFAFVTVSIADEISVEQSSVTIKNVPLGEKFEVLSSPGRFISIKNKSSSLANFRFEIMSCKEYGCKPHAGFEDIPKIKWFKVKSPEITVSSRQIRYIRDVFLKIPKRKKYYGRKFQAIVKVEIIDSPGETMTFEDILPIFIETEQKMNNKGD